MMVSSRLRFSAQFVSCVVTLLLLFVTAVVRTEAACSAQEAASFRFSVTSRRNETRHRIVTVDLANDAPAVVDGRNSRNQVSLDVSHAYSECRGVERVLMGTVATAQDPRPRRPDYELFPDMGYYKLHTTAQLWEGARSTCVGEEAHLMVINSDSEADVVKQIFSRKPKVQGSQDAKYMYLGFHDKYVEGHFTTVTGESLGYTRWQAGQPDGGAGSNYGGVEKLGLLHDVPNDWKLAFICEQGF